MSRSFRWVGVRSSEELADALPLLLADGERDTVLFNAARWRDEGQVAHAVRDTFALVADNDGTVIHGSQWLDVRARMADAHRLEDERDVAAYFRGERTDAGDVEFLFRCLGRLVASRLTRAHLEEDVRRQVPRTGTRELFASYREGHRAVVSHGLRSYIECWAAHHEIAVDEIHALRLHWEPHGDTHRLVGGARETAVVEATKRTALDRFSQKRGLDGNEVLVLEDTPRMLARMRHPNNLGVLLVPRDDPQPSRPQERLRQIADPELFPAFDLVLVSDSLEPLVAMRGGHL